LRRAGLVAAGVLVAVAGLIGLALAFNARDDPELARAPEGPGELQPDRGAEHDGPAQVTDPWPTSGGHRPERITRDRRELTDDQILHALELGNVVILYEEPDPALEAVQRDVAGPFDAELAAAGQAVILARREGAGPATALAWRRVLQAEDPRDPRIQEFAEAWLGRGLGQ
jgi:hypothetical protein